MQITKLDGVDGFVAVDLPEASTAAGIVRCARKILADGATNLARARTYQYAAFGIARSGASAGINAEGDARDGAVAAFVQALAAQVASGELTLEPGKGVSADDLAAWGAPASPTEADVDAAIAAGVVAAARAARDLDGTTVAVEAGAPAATAIAAAFTAAGAASADVMPLAALLGSGAAVVVVGSKNGVLDHDNVGTLGDALVLGAAPLAITARGLATGTRQGATILPDFVTSAGAVLAAAGESDPPARIAEVVGACLDHTEGPFLGACYAAEDFLRTWATELPFGRPMA